MKKGFSLFLFYAIAVLSMAWTSTLTYAFIEKVLPHLGVLAPAFALVVFDIGMVSWMFVFLNGAEGLGQRGIAIGGTLFDFAGVGLMAAAEIWLGGQTLVAAPPGLAEWALNGIVTWTIVNVGLVLAFHIASPSARREMALQSQKDKMTTLAYQKLDAAIDGHADEVAITISAGMKRQAVEDVLGKAAADEALATQARKTARPDTGAVDIIGALGSLLRGVNPPAPVKYEGDATYASTAPADDVAVESIAPKVNAAKKNAPQ